MNDTTVSISKTEDNREYLIEEYKALKHEIDQNQRDVFRIIEFGLAATATLFTVAFADFLKDEFRWILLFTPWLVLFPSTITITQRVRHIWIIGRYIQYIHEPKFGFNWERINFQKKIEKKKKRLIFPFVWGSSLVLVFIQFSCPALSAYAIYSLYNSPNPPSIDISWVHFVWSVVTFLVVVTIVYQIIALNQANHPEKYAILPEYRNES